VVEILLEYDANVNLVDSKGSTCLHLAAWRGNTDIVVSILVKSAFQPNVNQQVRNPFASARRSRQYVRYRPIRCQFITVLCSAQNNDQETPLHCAAQFGHSSVCTLLLQHGADAGIRNFRRETALDLASEYGRFESAEVIIRLRPELLSRDLIPIHSPLHLASKNGHSSVVKMLLNSGFNVNYVVRTDIGLPSSRLHQKRN
jgi:ankyrin repeat protein